MDLSATKQSIGSWRQQLQETKAHKNWRRLLYPKDQLVWEICKYGSHTKKHENCSNIAEDIYKCSMGAHCQRDFEICWKRICSQEKTQPLRLYCWGYWDLSGTAWIYFINNERWRITPIRTGGTILQTKLDFLSRCEVRRFIGSYQEVPTTLKIQKCVSK